MARRKKNTDRGNNKQSHAEKTQTALSSINSSSGMNAALLRPITPLPYSKFSSQFKTRGTNTPKQHGNADILVEPIQPKAPKIPNPPNPSNYGATLVPSKKKGAPPQWQWKNKSDEMKYNLAVQAHNKQWKGVQDEFNVASNRYKTDIKRYNFDRGKRTQVLQNVPPGGVVQTHTSGSDVASSTPQSVGPNGVL
jgi:hypothetical protein